MSNSADPLNEALRAHQAGDMARAESLYRQIVAARPQHAHVWHFLGALCLQTGRAAEAVELIGKAISLDPSQADFFSHLGAAHGALGQHEQSIASLRHAVRLAPQSAGIHYNLGTALRNGERLEEAVTSFRHAIAADPNSAEAHYNLANTLRELKDYAAAETSYRAALRIRPRYTKAMINLGNVLRDQDRLDEAIATLRESVALDPGYANTHLNLGTVLRDAGQYEEALACLNRAVELNPQTAEGQNNLGTALQAVGRYDEAVACYEKALRLDPQLADAHFSWATHLLRGGDIRGGFAEYEWRWKCKTFSDRKFGKPRWDGSPLAGRTILLHAEQGLGDTLQFIRFARQVQERGGRVIVECQAPLLPLLQRTPGVEAWIAAGSPLPPFDVHCPMLSLPYSLGLSSDQLASEPYLFADEALVTAWREKLSAYDGLRVGVCWQGNPKHLFDRQRSFRLEQLVPLAAVEGVRLFSLQKGPGSEQVEQASFPIIDLGPQLDESGGAFVDTAAVMKNLDLVIASDTSIAHLAGGLGVPTWVALSVHADWRWMQEREDTPWYPTMRLFRQQSLGQWPPVFEAIAARLAERSSGR